MQWDPTQYLRYGGERLRPALDLMAQVRLSAPAHVVDLGCGPGNVTAILKQRWPEADVLGIDSSPEMLEKARLAAPDCRFAQGSFGDWAPEVAPALIYSNAALHWLDGHETLFPRLLGLLAKGGVLAVQMPGMHAAPLRALQNEIAANGPWADELADADFARPILEPPAYWDLLRPHCAALDMWETTYMHALQGEDAAVQWAMGTSLKPFLDRLSGDLRAGFLAAYTEAMREPYPRRADGSTLVPFRRVFMVATV
ncbi:MAG TPA: methyltransferase domain-containing protein [Acetobacteraceae bacterium]|jgi:trans-aconitate 2-methyltransferase|nr:methyltransferase domain-containing protein [Acetobacteraceae bacterium]